MYISSIQLLNFKSYQSQEFIFKQPTKQRNIALIGGLNGYGKTSILEAIYLCLYGKNGMSYLQKAGLNNYYSAKSSNYKRQIESTYFYLAKPGGHMSVAIEINCDGYNGFRIERKWFFDQNKRFDSEEAVFYEQEHGKNKTPHSEEEIDELLEQYFVPVNLAQFFFFDGEEVKKIANEDKRGQIKSGLEHLLGVMILRKLESHLDEFYSQKKKGVHNISETQVKKKQIEYEACKEEEKKIKDTLNKLNEEKNELNTRRTKIQDNYTLLCGTTDTASLGELSRKLEEAKIRKDTAKDNIDNILSDKIPLNLVRKETIQFFKNQIKKENNRKIWERNNKDLNKKREIFIENYKNEISDILSKINEDDQNTLLNGLQAVWNKIFLPKPKDFAEKIYFTYLNENSVKDIEKSLLNIKIGSKTIHNERKIKDKAEEQIRVLKKKIRNIEGVEIDGTTKRIKDDLEKLNSDIDNINKKIGDYERQEKSICASCAAKYAAYQQIREDLVRSAPASSLIRKVNTIQIILDELLPRLFGLKVQQLSNKMTEIYKQISHKENVAKIKINEDCEVVYLNENNEQLHFDHSAGEDQLFATALLSSLAEISNSEAPLIVDTPLGRLDSIHRQKIIDFWMRSTNGRQIILLSHDKEIGISTYELIKDHVNTSYILRHNSIDNGRGKTIAEEGYFNEK